MANANCCSLLFGIAVVGILGWNITPLDGLTLDSLSVTLALTCLCIDQGRMAWVDLDNIHQVTLSEQRVRQFNLTVLSTIAIELIGFYLAWQWLGVGTALVLISQLFFNATAKVQLYPGSSEPIQSFGLKERSAVLIANAVALGLIALWQLGQFRQVAAALLLFMVMAYLAIKYLFISTAVNEGENL